MTRSGIDLSAIDPDTRPQDDLFRHVNGRWIDSHEIPADRAMDGSFRALHDQAEEHVRDIITDSATDDAEGVAAKIGAVYASFMDTDAV
ncbi:peptidase M13, partial [Cellulomonas rhizosphaerae]